MPTCCLLSCGLLSLFRLTVEEQVNLDTDGINRTAKDSKAAAGWHRKVRRLCQTKEQVYATTNRTVKGEH